jgi:hypothetical protein
LWSDDAYFDTVGDQLFVVREIESLAEILEALFDAAEAGRVDFVAEEAGRHFFLPDSLSHEGEDGDVPWTEFIGILVF